MRRKPLQQQDRTFQKAMEVSLIEDCGIYVVCRKGAFYWCRDYEYLGDDSDIVAEFIAGEPAMR